MTIEHEVYELRTAQIRHARRMDLARRKPHIWRTVGGYYECWNFVATGEGYAGSGATPREAFESFVETMRPRWPTYQWERK